MFLHRTILVTVATCASASPVADPIAPAELAATAVAGAIEHARGGEREAASPVAAASPFRGRIRGEVGFSRREKVTGAIVALVGDRDASRLILTATDPDGIFVAEGIPEGRYRITIFREGLKPAVEEGFEVRRPFRAEADITVQRGEGTALVDLSNGSAATAPEPDSAFAQAALDGVPGSPGAGETLSTKAATVGASGSAPAGEGASEAPDVDRQVSVIVRARSDSSRQGTRFAMRRLGGGVDPLIGEANMEGRLTFPLPPPGDYNLVVESPGQIALRVDRLRIGAGPLTIEAFLVPKPLGYPGTPADLLPEEKPLPPPELVPAPPPAPAPPAVASPPPPSPALPR